MNKRARELIVKLFSLILAITMSIPTNVFASSGTKRPKEMPTVIRLADSGGGGDTYIEDTTEDTYIEDGEEVYIEDTVESTPQETTEVIEEAPQEEASTIAEEDARNYILSQKGRLNDNHDGIIYDIKVAKKEKSYHDPAKNLSLSLMLNSNQALKDIKLTKVAIDGKEEKREDGSNKIDDLHTLNLSTPTFENEITYTLEASIDKKEIDTNKLYSMDLSLDIGQFNLVLQRISYKFVEYEKEDKTKELKLTHIKEAEDALRSISYKKDDGDVDKVIYTDYIISKDKGDEESRVNEKNKIQYGLNLENLKKEDTEISLDYYKADDKGFNMKKEFSAKIPYQDKLDLDIPASYILKLTVTSKTDKKNTKIESHKINGREVKSPRFVKEEEKSSEDDEEAAKKAEEEKKAAEEKAKAEETRKAEEAKKAEAEKQAEEANKAEEEAKSAEEKREAQEKAKSEQEAKEAKEQEASDKLKAEKEASNKEAKKKDDLLNSLKEESPTKEEENKAKTEVKEDSNLSKADAELKAALADKTKGIEDIQNLLTNLGEKYKLTREDQAKLMTANDAAIKALVEKDREENFRPNVLATKVPSNSFADKKFNLKATIQVKATDKLPIPKGHYFDVKVGPYLTKDPNEPIKDLTYNGKTIATGEYIEEGHYIRYTYVDEVRQNMDLNIDQILAFYTSNIGYVSYVDIDIKVAPKGNPVQSMPTKTVRRNDPSPVDSSYTITDQGEIKSGTYPYQLNWRTTSQKLKDNKGNPIDKLVDLDKDKLQGAYVEWDIEVDTDKLIDSENELTFDNLNLTVFGSAKQGLQDFRFRASKTKTDLDETDGYTVSDNMGELLSQSTQIPKSQLGGKLYIKVKALIDPNQVHETYNIGFRINPDKNYIDNLLTEYKDRFDRLPTPIKWLKGVEDAQRFAEVPFNLVETNIPATFLGLNDKFTNERFYYDNTRTIVADRKSDTRADWYALDLLRRGETQDSALDNPTFDINNGKKDQTIKPTKVYFIPLKDGGYRRTSQAQDAILPNGQYYPGTIVSYEYVNEEGKRNDTYNFRADLKEKKKNNIDESYDTEGGSVNLFTEKVSNQALLNGYLAYVENPYPVMRINKNFDMVSCFNDRINAPVYDGSKGGVFLDIHEDVSGDYLLSRLNESIDNPSGTYRLKNLLQPKVPYEGGVYLNNGNKTDGQAMEELMKKIYFYGEEVKKEYSKERNNEEMHRMVEASMYQRVIHHFTDGKALSEDYFDAPSNYNVDDWKVEHTLQGNRKPYPKEGWDDSFEGTDKDRTTDLGLRKLKDKETRIKDYPPVQKTQYEMAKRLYRKVIDSYKNDNNWDDDKADSVKLVFYSHTDEGKYQELIAGRVMAPIEIDKYKRSGDKIFAEKLPGAEFKFTNVATGESKEWTSPKENDKVNKLYLRPGTYKVQEINTPTGYEKIKDFEITVKSTEINPDDGKYNAKKLPKIHVNDGYKTEVVLAGNLPQTPDGKALVKIDEKNNIKVNVANIEDNLGKLEFIKRNKFVKLNGAEFRLRKINAKDLNDAKTKFKTPENLTYDAKYDKKSQGSYGEFKFEQIPAGFYVLEETKVPEGYEKAPLYLIHAEEKTDASDKKKVEVSFVQEYKEVTNEKGEKESKIADANLETEEATRDGKKVDLPIIRNKTKETEIKFRKVRTENLGTDKEHLGLGDAKFRLMSLGLVDGDFYLKEDFTDHSKPTNEGEDTRVDGQKARGGGYITFDGLKAGEYLLEELQAPKGYNKTTLYGWKLVVSELKADDEATGKKKGDLSYKLYEVPTGKDLNRTDLKEVKLDDIINGKDKKIKAFQIGNDARKISVPFKKYKGKIVEKDGKTEVETEKVNEKLFGENDKAVSFDLYKSDFYGAIIGEKDESGNIKPYKKNITQDANGNFNLEGLEFGGYYILRETNPPKGYDKAADITLKVEAEAIADEGKMKVIVRDPNTNAKTDLHSVFQGVIDFEEGEKLGKFSIKKVGNAIGQKDENGNPIKVGLRRAYFRLYTANDKYEIEYNDPEKKYPKEYIQKVTPGDPITHEEDGKQVGTKPEDLPPNQGIVTFDNLKPGKYVLEEYRGPAGYERDPNYWYILVEKNGTVKKYRDNPANTTDPRTVDGNLIEIFNKDETGFRIPLRISKVNENKAALTGSQFKARKLINGEDVKIYEKNDDGSYTDTGKYGHPKYYNEKFDGVSEATGKPGDNYFRELTPGIYELTEIKTPNDSYRLPKDKDGNDMKWYFKVVINKDKVPSDAGYMDITFDFEHTFKETDDFNSAITEEEKKALIGTTIKGFTRGDPDFARYIEEVKDDGRSDPARPDAPYKWIHDARVTNYKNKTKLGFMKKDSETHRNISGAVFSLRKAKLDKDGKLVFENNKPAYAPEKTTGEDGKPLTEAELNLQRVQPYDKDKKFAKAVSNEKLGVEFTNIDEGTYILEEIEPAKGYKKTDSFLAIKFTEGEDGAWKQEVKAYAKDKDGVYKEMSEPNDFVGRDDGGEFVSVKNDKAYTKLKFQKIEGNKDSKGNEVPVESADFRLTQVDKDGKKIPGGYDKPLYSYGNSNFEFTNIPVGRYKLQETRAITKFEKPDPWFFNVVQDPESHKLKIVFEKDPKNDPNGKLDESIGFKTKTDGSPDYDADGNLQDIKIRNYSKTSFSFMKLKNETDEKGNKLPLKDAYFRLTKVRYSMDEKSKAYEYYGEKEDAVLKKYTNGKKVTEYKPDGTIEKYTYDGTEIENGNDNYKPDSISSATGKYSSLRRSQRDGSVDFQDLGEGIYQLEEVGIPDGYESGNDQTKWIFEVKKTDNGLKVDHNVKTEKNYFENYDTSTYYKDFYKDYYEKVYSENATNPKPKPNIEGDEKNGYSITNTKATTNLKWKKIGSEAKDNVIKDNVIKKYTKFALLKTSDNPDDIDSTDEKTLKNAIDGQSDYPPYLVESTEGIFEIKDLSKGIYNLVETDAPEGYEMATRSIAIKVYEDKNGAIQKQFYEIENGKLIKEAKDFNTLLTRNQKEVDTDTDEDGNKVFYFKNKSKPYHFDLSKVYKENGDFKDITKGKLKIRIKADPADKTNDDKNVYEQTIDLSDAKSYRINLNSDIQMGKDYILEEVESPDGYAKTNYRYRLRFSEDTSQTPSFVATLVAVLKEVEKEDGTKTWTPLKNSSGQNITDSDQLLAGGKSINSEFQFRIVNNKTEIEFTKVGKDEVKGTDGKINYKYTPLKDVEFYLEKQDPDDIHKDNQGYYPLTENMEMIKPETDSEGKTTYYYIDRKTGKKVTKTKLVIDVTPENSRKIYKSDAYGKFKITDLTDGYYRIKEPQAPKGYMQVIGAVKKFKVDQGRVYVFEQDITTGQETAKEVTDKNIGSLGKIINEKPGKGKFELKKTNEKGDVLDKVEFELYNSEGTKIKDYTTNSDGKISFEGLPYGSYWLRETKTKDGYIVDRRIRQVRLGKDWNVPSKPSKPKDVTNSIKFDGSQPQLKSIGSQTSSYKTVYPNQQEAMLAYFKFKIADGADVKPGDTFTLKFSDNVDLYGIYVDNNGNGNVEDDNYYNIYSDAGLVAKAMVNPDKRSITYTFTEYLDNYNVENMRLSLQLYADRYKVPFSQNINVTASVGKSIYRDDIYVDYRGYTEGQSHIGYQDPRVDVSSYMLRLNPDTGEFTTVVYYNPWNDTTSNNRYFEFSTSAPVDIDNVKLFEKTGYGSHVDRPRQGDLPDSYGIAFENANSYAAQGLTKKTGTFAAKDYTYQNYYMYIDPNGGTNDSTYVMVIQGKLKNISTTKSLKTTAYYNFPYWNYNYWENNNYGYFHTWSQFYRPEGTSQGTPTEEEPLKLDLVNFKNRIEFMKVDGGVKANVVDTAQTDGTSLKDKTPGSALANAKFKLQFKEDKNGKWTETNYGEKTSDDKGFFSWEALAPGYYQVIETETPDNSKYDLPKEPVATFRVDEYGNIVDVVPDDLILENYKKAEIKIRKTDQDGEPLKGADFTLTPTSGQKDPSNPKENYKIITKTTGEDGIATFDKLVVGKYTLTEEKAPDGYKKTDREYYLEVTKDGKVLWTNSFYDSYNNMKQVDVKTYTGQDQENLRSEIVGIDKENKKFRQIVTITAKSSELEKARLILESKAKGIKLSQANTEVRVVQYDGSDIKDKDGSTYTVNINNGDNPNLALRINPPYRKKEENKSQGSDESTSPEENDGDIVRTYKVIVDMPYGDDEKLGAKVNYDIGKISETTGKVEFTRNDEVKEVDKYAEKKNYFAHRDHTSPLNYKAQYLPRDINLITTDIANIKQPDIYLKKVDADDKTALAGAEFELQKKVGDVYKSIDKKGNVIESPADNADKWTATSDGQGNFEFKSIPDGEYRIFETKAPVGYAPSDKTVYKIKVKKGKIYKVDKEIGVAERTELTVGTDKKPNSESNRIEITNKKAQYPSTGGPGVWIGFTILGVLTMTAAGIYLAQKKKYQTK